MTRLRCPACRGLVTVPREHNILVECPCGAPLTVRADVAGHHLRERSVDDATIDLALAHLRPEAP